MVRTVLSAAFGALIFIFSLAGAWAAELKLHGSSTVTNTLMMPHKAEIEATSGHSLTIVGNGSSRGLIDLMEGKADLGMISAPLETTIAKIEKKQPGATAGKDLQGHQVAETRVAFALHPSNPVKSLSLGQVADIMAGKIKNWNEVGGADAPIIVVVETPGGGVRSMVEKELLDKGDIGAETRVLPNSAQVVKVVAQMPQAIGIAIAATVDGSKTVALETDEVIAQPLILVSLGDPSTEAQQVIDAARKASGF
jgi:phosphate transport system substrate-binding protein